MHARQQSSHRGFRRCGKRVQFTSILHEHLCIHFFTDFLDFKCRVFVQNPLYPQRSFGSLRTQEIGRKFGILGNISSIINAGARAGLPRKKPIEFGPVHHMIDAQTIGSIRSR